MKELCIEVKCPIDIHCKKDDILTMYKNPNGLYVVIKDGQEVGLASKINSNETIKKEEIPCSLNGIILEDSYSKEFRFVAMI